MMASFWPTAMAHELFPVVAKNLNKAGKIVCSKTLKHADWHNTTIIGGDLVEQVKQLKATASNNITILGSGTFVAQLTDAALIDEYTFMLDPIAIGQGSSIFGGVQNNLALNLVSCRVLENDGIVLLNYTKKG